MVWSRMKDWLLGSVATVLVLVLVLAVAWWAVTDPADAPAGEPVPPTGPAPDPRYDPPAGLGEEQVWFAELSLDSGTVVTGASTLRNVRAVGQDVVTGPDGLVAARVIVDATVPFEVVADELGNDTDVRATADGQVMVTRTVEVLGRELQVVATGTVEAVGGRLVVHPSSIDVGGPDLISDATADVVRELVTIDHPVEGLPPGLTLHDVGVQSDGFRAHLRGHGVRLVP